MINVVKYLINETEHISDSDSSTSNKLQHTIWNYQENLKFCIIIVK